MLDNNIIHFIELQAFPKLFFKKISISVSNKVKKASTCFKRTYASETFSMLLLDNVENVFIETTGKRFLIKNIPKMRIIMYLITKFLALTNDFFHNL